MKMDRAHTGEGDARGRSQHSDAPLSGSAGDSFELAQVLIGSEDVAGVFTPGELLPAEGTIELNANRATLTLTVANTGDRPIQVGSHYHFFETNAALGFDRDAARGYRLDIAAGTAVRFEPGQTRTVQLVALAGDRKVYGFRGLVQGAL